MTAVRPLDLRERPKLDACRRRLADLEHELHDEPEGPRRRQLVAHVEIVRQTLEGLEARAGLTEHADAPILRAHERRRAER